MKSVKARPGATRRAASPRARAAAAAVAARFDNLERRVLEVIRRHPGWDIVQIAAELRMDVFDLADVVQPLIERGVVGKHA